MEICRQEGGEQMNNLQFVGFDEKGNAIVLIPVTIPKGQLEPYLRFQYNKRKERVNEKVNNNQ